mgnify:CR=1 FL=1
MLLLLSATRLVCGALGPVRVDAVVGASADTGGALLAALFIDNLCGAMPSSLMWRLCLLSLLMVVKIDGNIKILISPLSEHVSAASQIELVHKLRRKTNRQTNDQHTTPGILH